MALNVVQSAHADNASSSTLTATFASAPTAGNAIVAFVADVNATKTPAHSSDTFTKIGAGATPNPIIEAYACIVGVGSSSKQVTVVPNTGNGCVLVVYEISGFGGSVVTDGFTHGSGTTSPVSSASFTTTVATDILLGIGAVSLGAATTLTAHSSPWTSEVNQNGTVSVWGYSSAYQVLAATGSQSWSQVFSGGGGLHVSDALLAIEPGSAPSNSVSPVASGTATVGSVVSSTAGTWSGSPILTYQWQRDNFGGGSYSNIGGATGTSYTLVDADDGCHIRSVVTGTNSSGSTSANSNALGVVVEPIPANTAAPTETGDPYVGAVLTGTDGTWQNMGGHSPSFALQWQRDNSGGGTYSDIASATSSTYTLVSADNGCNVRFKVTATNTGGSTQAFSTAQLISNPPAVPANTVAPVVSGVPDVGVTLRCSTGTWTPTLIDSYTYQWQQDTAGDLSFSNISSATSSTYTLVSGNQGNTIRCVVTAHNFSGAAAADSNNLTWVDFFLSFQVEFGNTFYELGAGGELDGVTSESGRVQAATITRGRQTAMDQINAATLDALANNQDGWLDPTNINSPWYGQILPLVKCRVRRRFNGVAFSLFTGRVERWIAKWLPPLYQQMEIPASDAFERLNNTVIVSDNSTLTTALTGANNDLVFTAQQAGENGDNISVTYTVAGTSTSLSTSTNQPLAGNAIVQAFNPARARGVSRFGLAAGIGQVPTAPPSAVTVSGSDITVDVATDGSGNPTSSASAVMNALNADADVAALVSVALAPSNTGAGTVTAMAQTYLTGGKWPQELTGDRIIRVLDLIGWDSGLRAVDAGTVEVIAQGFSITDNMTALQHLQNVADAELGYVFVTVDGVIAFHDANHRATAARSTVSQATFADDGTGFKYTEIVPSFDKDKIFNQVTVQGGLQTSVPQTASDAYSQSGTGSPPTGATQLPDGGFGTRSLSTRSTSLASDSDALAQAESIVSQYAYPRVRFQQITTLEPPDGDALHDAWVASVLDLEIGDRVTVRTTPPATSSTSTFDAFVEQVTDTIATGQRWKRDLLLTAITETSGGGGGGGGGGTSGSAMLNMAGTNLVLDDATDGLIG